MSNFYIADLHLGHENAMRRFDHRPFKSLEEQDRAIIANINNRVSPRDNLYLLGDVSWYKPDKTAELIKQIKCKNRYLIVGNHDSWIKDGKCKKLFQGIYDLKRINDEGRIVVLCHYPLAVWDQSHRGSYHLYGHVHNTREWKLVEKWKNEQWAMGIPSRLINVGCMMDYMRYTPRTLTELLDANPMPEIARDRKDGSAVESAE